MVMEKFNEHEKAAVTWYIRKLDQVRDAAVFGQGILEISKRFGKVDLQEVERILRTHKSLTTLISLSVDTMPQYESMLPHSGQKKFPFYLYMTVNGDKEAEEMLRQIGLTSKENFERLPETGMLVPKRGSAIRKITESR
jgi:hypothetical protein